MTLKEEEYDILKKYITDKDARYRLTDYISRHDVIGQEVFPYIGDAAKHFYKTDGQFVYRPVTRDTFIKRVPIYFYEPDTSAHNIGDLQQYIHGVLENRNFNNFEQDLETLYSTLEKFLYYYKIDIETIFEYPIKQTGRCSQIDFLYNWFHYLQLAEKLNIQERTPEHLIVAYNYVLEKSNLCPIIYDLHEQYIGDYISRSGNRFSMEGTFPCNEKGDPILRWIGVKIKNAAKIWVNVDNKLKGTLYVEANHETAIWGRNCWGRDNDGSDVWYELYIAPMLMEFDHVALKSIRKREKLTQQQVADSIGAAVRTYQKWESGHTTPDCQYLLRLMNVLDIREAKEITKTTNF
ncbi:hypothetical protein LK13_05580 [Paenibacillus polymyxa]|uniref:helix-turn-helix domain-containing protein n=1 Tax=Paenibacillus polymyxa TaxID=1406 RepID=UPI00042F3C16|nr:helix-turn-helix transcriptional regulator [Paenibacillus polymyxa]AHM67316.1 hypothetical protein PPSQR21_036780 [Paenibacillus polymyxa SQR-21]AIY08093.1 hypothetical protein LK13_05580 [Paenibacillus polymyxa]